YVAAASPTNVTFTAPLQTAGAVETWTVGFKTTSGGALAAGDDVTVNFDNHFTVPASPTLTLTSGFSHCSPTSITTTGSNHEIVNFVLANSGGTCGLAASTSATLTVAGVTNPAAGSYGPSTFKVKSKADTGNGNPASAIVISACAAPTVTTQ